MRKIPVADTRFVAPQLAGMMISAWNSVVAFACGRKSKSNTILRAPEFDSHSPSAAWDRGPETNGDGG